MTDDGIYKCECLFLALSEADASTAAIPGSMQTITYSSFKRPLTISENEYTAGFVYNEKGDRVKMEVKKTERKC